MDSEKGMVLILQLSLLQYNAPNSILMHYSEILQANSQSN